ncbi:hypothetical protein ABES03_14195 [Neobacillus rhizosphaerae]|uniref:hypothetical protein n=1 Tax=Neobacillus rhizosphaerae TaxID=2880965 RepID=UPI003D2C61E5
MQNNFIFFVVKIFSWSPFCRISDDRFFGEIRRGETQKHNLRISLFSFNMGKWILHLFTYNFTNMKPKFLFVLNLSKVHIYPDLNRLGANYNVYENELKQITEQEKLSIQKDALAHKVTQIETVKNQTFNKFLAYLSISVFILPLYSAQFNKIYSIESIYKKTFIIILAYLFINLIYFFYKFIKVKSVERVTFNSIRSSQDPLITFILMLYYEWRSMVQESTYQVTLIKNIEKYIMAIISWSLIILFVYNIIQYNEEFHKIEQKSVPIEKSVTNIIHMKSANSFKDFLKNNNKTIVELEKALLDNRYEKILVVSNNKNVNYKKTMELINIYNVHTSK